MTTRALTPFCLLLGATLLSACGGSNSNTPTDTSIPPPAQDSAAFAASKVGATRMDFSATDSPFRLTVNGQIVRERTRERNNPDSGMDRYDYRSLPPGMATLNGTQVFPESGIARPLLLRSYQGFHSGVNVAYHSQNHYALFATYGHGAFTDPAKLPTLGQTTYRGTAFNATETGNLTYYVDFGAKIGRGQIDGLHHYGTITLEPLSVDPAAASVHTGTAHSDRGQQFDYQITFAGNAAEEMVGVAIDSHSGNGFGFHGTRDAMAE